MVCVTEAAGDATNLPDRNPAARVPSRRQDMAKIYFGMYAEFIVGASHGNEKANDELIGRFDVNREESRRGLRLVVAVMAAATAPLPDRIHPRGEL